MSHKERIEFSTHTFSGDGYASAGNLLYAADGLDMPGIAITDRNSLIYIDDVLFESRLRGMVDRHNPFKVIFGFSVKIVDDLNCINRPENIYQTFHMAKYDSTIILKNQDGLKEFFRLKSIAESIKLKGEILMSDILKVRDMILLGYNPIRLMECDLFYESEFDKGLLDEAFKFIKNYDYVIVEPPTNYVAIDTIIDDLKVAQDDVKNLIDYCNKASVLPIASSNVFYTDTYDVDLYSLDDSYNYSEIDRSKLKRHLASTEELLQEFAFLGKKKAKELVVNNTHILYDKIGYVNPFSMDKKYPIIKGSDKKLIDECFKKAKAIYGENLPEEVKYRLEREISGIIDKGYSYYFILIKRLTDKAKANGESFNLQGSGGALLVTYFLGISDYNPLPPHYYCPKCHHFEIEGVWKKDLKLGDVALDLKDKKCPLCNCRLKKDGYDIPIEAFTGLNFEREPYIGLFTSPECQKMELEYLKSMKEIEDVFFNEWHENYDLTESIDYIKEYFESGEKKFRYDLNFREHVVELARKHQHKIKRISDCPDFVLLPKGEDILDYTPVAEIKDKPLKYMTAIPYYNKSLMYVHIEDNKTYALLKELERMTGVNLSKIPLNDKKVLSLFLSPEALGINDRDIGDFKVGTVGSEIFDDLIMIGNILPEVKPSNISDIIRCLGMYCGSSVWEFNAEDLILDKNIPVNKCIAFREDIIQYLLSKGMEKKPAYDLMESIRKGKGRRFNETDIEFLDNYDIPDWYIESCKKIVYLIPKAQAVGMAITGIRLLYYKLYYPEIFYKSWIKHMPEHVDEKFVKKGKKNAVREFKILNDRATTIGLNEEDSKYLKELIVVLEMFSRGVKI